MILSEAELGLAAKSPGIMALPDSWEPGELLADHFTLADWVLEVEVTPNRPDCLSIRGLAREIAAITEAPFSEEISFPHPWGKRPVDEDRIERIVNGIQRRLETEADSEVTSRQIGEIVMDTLKEVDQVAYVRFASVYRNFGEAKDFREFLGKLDGA